MLPRRLAWAVMLLAVAAGLAICSGCGPTAEAQEDYLVQARQVLPQALTEADPAVRALGLEAYRDLKKPVPEDKLKVLVTDPEVPARFLAVLARAEQAKPVDATYFRKVFSTDADASVRLASVYGLARLKDYRNMTALCDGLLDPNPFVRRSAAMILGLLGNSSAVPMLQAHLNDRDVLTQLAVAEALVKLGDVSALETIRRHARDEATMETAFRQVYAIMALGRVGDPVEDVNLLRGLFLGQKSLVAAQLAARGARIRLGDFTQASFLIDVAEADPQVFGSARPEPDERAYATQLLARAAYAPAWRKVGPLLTAGEPMIRYSAAWAIQAFSSEKARETSKFVNLRAGRPQQLGTEEILQPYEEPILQSSPATGPAGATGAAGGPLQPLPTRTVPGFGPGGR